MERPPAVRPRRVSVRDIRKSPKSVISLDNSLRRRSVSSQKDNFKIINHAAGKVSRRGEGFQSKLVRHLLTYISLTSFTLSRQQNSSTASFFSITICSNIRTQFHFFNPLPLVKSLSLPLSLSVSLSLSPPSLSLFFFLSSHILSPALTHSLRLSLTLCTPSGRDFLFGICFTFKLL